ncbi:hypothetical protein [Corynebacterium resistens]|nr:hypothetical protein [Corynebacterium resistens]
MASTDVKNLFSRRALRDEFPSHAFANQRVVKATFMHAWGLLGVGV